MIKQFTNIGRDFGSKNAQAAKKRGVALLNNGAGTMPSGAAAPFGGERYTLLQDPPGS